MSGMTTQARLIGAGVWATLVFLTGAAMLGVGILQHTTIVDIWYGATMCSQQIVHPQAIVEPPVDTGLLDQDGRRIFRVPDEIGFLPRREGR